ncbi:hypothetical protein TSMEX_008146 [Taenia solium]|eukprot:TsM_000142000 transcript=TsM_000142000 gene=TsM_000142000
MATKDWTSDSLWRRLVASSHRFLDQVSQASPILATPASINSAMQVTKKLTFRDAHYDSFTHLFLWTSCFLGRTLNFVIAT